MKERSIAFDIVKGFAIFLVIFGHLTNAGEPQRILIFSFHMPLFMLVAGYFFKPLPVSGILKKAFGRYLLIAYSTLFLDILLQFTLYGRWANFPTGQEWLQTVFLYRGLWLNIPIWFVFTLTLCQVLCTVTNKMSYKAVLALVVAFILFNEYGQKPIVWWVNSTLYAFPFFGIGFLLKKCGKAKKVLARPNIFVTVLLVATYVGLSFWNGYTDMYTLTKGKSFVAFLYTGITGTLLMIWLSKYVADKHRSIGKAIAFLGTKTFPILITHYYFCRIFLPKILRYFEREGLGQNIVFQLVVSCLLIEIYYAIFRVYERRSQSGKRQISG